MNAVLTPTSSLPDFLIVGAAKSGTTSLHMYLGQHPEVFLPHCKEPNYFALAGESLPKKGPASPKVMQAIIYSHCITDSDQYRQLFAAADPSQKCGEASVRYLYFEKAAERIRNAIPSAKCIAILREPVARLYSHYCMNVQYLLEPLGVLAAVEQEEARREAGWGWDYHYVNVGLYADQIERYFDLFGRDQVKVLFYDDFRKDARAVFREVCRHLEIDDQFEPDMSQRGKVTSRPRSKMLGRWLYWPGQGRQTLRRILPQVITPEFHRKTASLESTGGAQVGPVTETRIGKTISDRRAETGNDTRATGAVVLLKRWQIRSSRSCSLD